VERKVEASHRVFLVILGVFVLSMLGRKKKPGAVFFDVIEIVDVRPKRRMPRIVVNLLIVAGIAAFLWIISRH
jgi:hypothetical protein